MEAELKILLLEDSADDAELLERQLRTDKLSFFLKRVDDRASLVAQLRNSHWDVILADYHLPQFSGVEVLECLREEKCDIPVILVTGSLSENLAADVIRPGIEDFVLKDRPSRLPLAIRKALERKSFERQEKQAQLALEQSRQQLRALAGKLQTAREVEGRRISREIHDELGQSLTGLKIQIARVYNKLSGKNDPLAAELATTEESISGMIQSVQRIVSQLRPRLLDDLGLGAAVRCQVQEFQRLHQIQCHYRGDIPDCQFSAEVSNALFRILQEALTNVARHAQATQVEIRLKDVRGTLSLEVRDNGRGIQERERSNPNSLGLLGMQERALLLGGTCEIAARTDGGTVVRAVIAEQSSNELHLS